jgi:hypothetical protein
MRGQGDQDGKAYEAQKRFSEFVKASSDSTVTLDFLEEVARIGSNLNNQQAC